jgi:seryl-tRNA synthetase
MDKVLLEKDLPIKMVAYGRCFRTEAGAAGAAGKGLYRVHQFTKVGPHLHVLVETSGSCFGMAADARICCAI